MNKLMLILLLLLVPPLSGCAEQEILDDLNIETAKAYDLADDNLIRATALYPRYSADKQIQNVTLTAEAETTGEVLDLLEKKSELPLVRGSLENVIISEEMARRGMLHIADSLQRYASVGSRVTILVSDGQAGDILKGNYGNKGTSDYISTLVEHNIKRGDLAESNLHLFLFNYYQKGQTPYLPMIEVEEDNSLDLNGIAIFKKDKMIDKVSKEDMFYFKLLADRHSQGNQVVKLPDEDGDPKKSTEASITSLKSTQKIRIDHHSTPVSINVLIEIKGIIREFTGDRLTPAKVKKVETQIEKNIVDHCLRMLRNFQDKNVDPIGFGQFQKHGVRKMDFKKWEEEQYPMAEISVTANVDILESGTVE
ncbi:Ger(x)C family spore germination protein [Rossellomorea vietnamensis]|uniref:Ger(X)C family spore germination protein n=1 Tax=Rossellomorea vietnamensis TaxID=218284 RepID=A0A5D4MBQ6_9BACI|nr:Ger(x)C family spore germination protein [Rossellomorea vietnamensis]TYR99041.1 Ger(x)C family spore germination protein [Rossellomorea vietnamensis]